MARFDWEKANLKDAARKNREVYYEYETHFRQPEAFIRSAEGSDGKLITLIQVNDYENVRKVYYVIKEFTSRPDADVYFDKLAKEVD